MFNPTPQTQEVAVKGYGKYLPLVAASNLSEKGENIEVKLAPFSFALYKTASSITPATPTSVQLLTQAFDNQRIHFGYNIELKQQSSNEMDIDLPAIAVKTYLIDAQGNKTLASTDFTQPYQSIIPPELLATTQTIEVVADDGAGNIVSQQAQFERALLP